MWGGRVLRQEVTFMVQDDGRVGLDRVQVAFDDRRAVSDAGVVLVATLAARLGIEALAQRFIGLGERTGAANAGRKVMTLIYAMALGADCIDDCELLRSGRLGALLGRVAAPSTLGTFLRAFTFGHVRQLDRLLAETLARAWAAGAGRATGGWSSTSTASSARSTAITSRAPRSAIPAGAATTRCWRRGRRPARCCTSGCGRGRRAARAASCALPTS